LPALIKDPFMDIFVGTFLIEGGEERMEIIPMRAGKVLKNESLIKRNIHLNFMSASREEMGKIFFDCSP
jgi:hypothetical protein